jgi:hypothetical protein
MSEKVLAKAVILCALSYIFVLLLDVMNNEKCCCSFRIGVV